MIEVTERVVQRHTVKRAKKCGWIPIKLGGEGDRGKPDYLFLKQGRLFFVEFKRPGGQPRKIQAYWIVKLKRQGFEAFAITTQAEGSHLVARMERKWFRD